MAMPIQLLPGRFLILARVSISCDLVLSRFGGLCFAGAAVECGDRRNKVTDLLYNDGIHCNIHLVEGYSNCILLSMGNGSTIPLFLPGCLLIII